MNAYKKQVEKGDTADDNGKGNPLVFCCKEELEGEGGGVGNRVGVRILGGWGWERVWIDLARVTARQTGRQRDMSLVLRSFEFFLDLLFSVTAVESHYFSLLTHFRPDTHT